jgi:hypothetical protein
MIQNKNKDVQEINFALQEKIDQKNQGEAITKKVEFIKDSQKKINSYFVDLENIDLFINKIETIGEENKIDLKVKNVEIPKTDEKYITISISLEGSFSNIIKTIQTIEYMSHKIHFKNIYLNKEISPDQEQTVKVKTGVPLWQMEASFEVLSY